MALYICRLLFEKFTSEASFQIPNPEFYVLADPETCKSTQENTQPPMTNVLI
jgi:hypothetical protein